MTYKIAKHPLTYHVTEVSPIKEKETFTTFRAGNFPKADRRRVFRIEDPRSNVFATINLWNDGVIEGTQFIANDGASNPFDFAAQRDTLFITPKNALTIAEKYGILTR